LALNQLDCVRSIDRGDNIVRTTDAFIRSYSAWNDGAETGDDAMLHVFQETDDGLPAIFLKSV